MRHEQDPRKFWYSIRRLWAPNQNTQCHVPLIDQDTGIPVPKDKIPDVFNHHLCQVGKSLASKFPDNSPFMTSMSNVRSEFCWRPITESEVMDLVGKIKIYKSAAVEGLSSRVLKAGFSVLTEQLVRIFNVSIQTCVFPSQWKWANVVVLHKGNSKSDVNNYRPISLLPLPAKIMESLIHKRIYCYLEENEILSKSQWGFRKNRSTIEAAAGLIETILTATNNKKQVGVLFVDLKKAFDSLSHNILLRKLYNMGIKHLVLDWQLPH